MILSVHMLFGAAIGYQVYQATHSVALATLTAFLCHYFLDLFPHVEYPIENLKRKQWEKSFFDLLKIFIDFLLGFAIIFLLSHNQPLLYVFAFVAVIPDGFTFISMICKNTLLELHDKVHTETIHYLTKQKKFPLFWRIATQAAIVIVSILLLPR